MNALSAEYIPGRRAQKRQDNRTSIMRSAVDMFGQNGVCGTTVREIIRNTDLAVGTFYNYFDSKECVFRAIIDEVGEALREKLHAARLSATDAHGFMEASFRAYFTFYAEHPEIFLMLRANQTYSGAWLEGADHQARTGLNELREDILEAMKSGLLPRQDADFLTVSVGGVSFALVDEMMQRKPVDPEAATRFATSLFLSGMGAN